MADIFSDVALSQGYRGEYANGSLLHGAIQAYLDTKFEDVVTNDATIQAHIETAVDAAVADIPAPGVIADPDVPGSYLIGY